MSSLIIITGTQRLVYGVRTAYIQLRDGINSFVDDITLPMCQPTTEEHAAAAARRLALIEQSNAYIQLMIENVSQPSDIDPLVEEADCISLVQFWHLVLHIKIHTSLSPEELAYDAYYDQFAAAFGYAENAFNIITTRGKKMTAALMPRQDGMPFLFWMAWKCRDFILRRRTADLLKASTKTFQFECDGFWVPMLERMIDIELSDSDSSIAGEVPDCRRIYAVKPILTSLPDGGNEVTHFAYKLGKATVQESTEWVTEPITP